MVAQEKRGGNGRGIFRGGRGHRRVGRPLRASAERAVLRAAGPARAPFRGPAPRAPGAAGRAAVGLRPGPVAGVPGRDPRDPRSELEGGPSRRRPHRPPGRDNRAHRPQDDDQRPQLRRQYLAGRLRGRQYATVAKHGRGPAQPARRARPDDRAHHARRQALRGRRKAGHHRGAPPGLAPGRKACSR